MDPDIIKHGKKLNDIEIKSHSEIKRAIPFVIDFIKSNPKRIVYGGVAIHLNLISTGKNAGIYDPDQINDYDFFTDTPIEDAIELCNILYKNNFRYIRTIKAMHGVTFSVRIEGEKTALADITFVPLNFTIPFEIFTNIAVKKSTTTRGGKEINSYLPLLEGIHYVSHKFLYIDLLTGFMNPWKNLFRWEKDFTRFMLLSSLFPEDISTRGQMSSLREFESFSLPDELIAYLNKWSKKNCLIISSIEDFIDETIVIKKRYLPLEIYVEPFTNLVMELRGTMENSTPVPGSSPIIDETEVKTNVETSVSGGKLISPEFRFERHYPIMGILPESLHVFYGKSSRGQVPQSSVPVLIIYNSESISIPTFSKIERLKMTGFLGYSNLTFTLKHNLARLFTSSSSDLFDQKIKELYTSIPQKSSRDSRGLMTPSHGSVIFDQKSKYCLIQYLNYTKFVGDPTTTGSQYLYIPEEVYIKSPKDTAITISKKISFPKIDGTIV